ncbi:MAG: PEP-utilizing enzyme [Patescibacteria group bacterium]|jgi:phosphohistidine swiveling domain-containing protein
MLDIKKNIFRWGPIPLRLMYITHWLVIYNDYPGRLHHYLWPESYVIFNGTRGLFICERQKLEAVGASIFEKLVGTVRGKSIWFAWNKAVVDLSAFHKKISLDNFSAMSDRALVDLWKKYNNLLFKFWEAGVVPELAAYGGESILNRMLIKEHLSKNELNEISSVIAAPERLSFYQEEEIDLLKLIASYRKNNFKNLLNNHQQRYFWLENSYFSTRVLPVEYFLKRLREKKRLVSNGLNEISKIKAGLMEIKKRKKKIIKLYQLDKKLIQTADKLSFCIWWQDQRKKLIFQYLHYFETLVREIARRNHMPFSSFHYAYLDEIRLPLKAVDKQRLFLRSKWHLKVARFAKNKLSVLRPQAAADFIKKFWEAPETTLKEKVISGLVVSSGKLNIRGQVYIVNNPNDIKKFPSGKILISSMTAPEYIVAIRRAKAIITDTGGLTCHAAIVSRELGIPCIVGTKVATKVFKNGDRVEIDANKGVIRKL